MEKMPLLIRRRGESPPSGHYYNDTKPFAKSISQEKPEAFVFSSGNFSLLSRRQLPMTAPMWHFTEVSYNSSEDEGSMDEDEVKPPVDDGAVDLFIRRVILASVVNEEDEESFGIDDPLDGSVEDMDYDNRPPRTLPSYDKQDWKKKIRKCRKNSDGRKEKMPVPEVVGPWGIHLPLGTLRGYSPAGIEMVQMPLHLYKETVFAEVDSLARRIYYYFKDELRYFDNIRVNALKDSFFWHEKTKVLGRMIETKEAEIMTLKKEKDALQSMIEGEKKLKRQRRADKKQRRKAEKTAAPESDPRESISSPAYQREKSPDALKKNTK